MVVLDNVWDAAIAAGNDHQMSEGPEESTLVVIGGRGAGKTTLMQHVVLEKSEAVKPTLALDYTYGRKDNTNLGKDVCHLWELGGGTSLTNLLETPLTNLAAVHVILVVDLVDTGSMWNVMETLFEALDKHARRICTQNEGLEQKLREKLEERMQKIEEEEKSRLKPLLVPVTLVGSKYDLFRDTESEQKKSVCRAMRFMAHVHGANLVFYSTKDVGQSRRMRSLISSLMFNEPIALTNNTDPSRPIVMSCFEDKLEFLSDDSGGLAVMRHNFVSLFPQREEDEAKADPSADPVFAEELIDRQRAVKQEELERNRREAQRRREQRAKLYQN